MLKQSVEVFMNREALKIWKEYISNESFHIAKDKVLIELIFLMRKLFIFFFKILSLDFIITNVKKLENINSILMHQLG